MRVLSIGNRHPPHGVGGYERVWVSLTAHLRGRGDTVDVLTTDTTDPGSTPVPDDPQVRRLLRWGWVDGRWATLDRAAARDVVDHDRAVLADLLATTRPDVVVFLNMGGLPQVLLHDVAGAGVPAIALVHDGWLVYGPEVDPAAGLRRPWRRPSSPPALARWVFNSAFVKDRSAERVTLRGPVAIVPPGIDADVFTPRDPDGPWAGRLLLPGRIAAEKGISVAVRALEALPGARLTLVGPRAHDGPTEAALTAARARGHGDRLLLPGPAGDAELLAAYAACDAVLFPVTWEEPFGLVPLEAMAVGRPVVATGTGGSAEYLRHEENCLLVPPGDADALADAVGRLAADPALVARLVTGGRSTAARYTARRHDEAVAAILDETVAAAAL